MKKYLGSSVTFLPAVDVRELLSEAVTASGETRTDLINECLRRALLDVARDAATKRKQQAEKWLERDKGAKRPH